MVAQILSNPKPVIGVMTLGPLPGSEGWDGDMGRLLARAEQEALALTSAGADALLLENAIGASGGALDFGARLDAACIAAMTLAAERITRLTACQIGISTLPNDPLSALAIALAVGAAFIRVPTLVGGRITESGMAAGALRALTDDRRRLAGADAVAVVADVTLNHIVPTAIHQAPWRSPSAYLAQAALATARHGVADVLLLNGDECAASELSALRAELSQTGLNPALWLELGEADIAACERATRAPVLPGEKCDSPQGEHDARTSALMRCADGVMLPRHALKKSPWEGLRETPRLDPFRLETVIAALHARRPEVASWSTETTPPIGAL